MEMMLFIVLALFMLSALDSLWSPRRAAARQQRRAQRLVAQRRSAAGLQPAWQNRCAPSGGVGARTRRAPRLSAG